MLGLRGLLVAATKAGYSEDERVSLAMIALVKGGRTTYETFTTSPELFREIYPTQGGRESLVSIAKRLNEDPAYMSRMEGEYEKFMQG